jgi:predicted metal-dependent peptidase
VDENHIISRLYSGDKPSPSDLKRLRKQLVEETRSAMAEKGIGKIAGMFDDELNMSVSDDVPWQHLLARFFTGLRKNDYRTFPFNKKHLWRKIYLPSIGAPGPEHIVVAIDTSGSMGADELSKILGELNQLKSTAECRMTLIQCDAEIQDIKEYNSWEIADIDFDNYGFRGRGGTTFEPVFDWIEKEVLNLGQRPDALFYLTDGYAGYGMQEPPYQVMWILTSSSIEPEQIPFGETIRMN